MNELKQYEIPILKLENKRHEYEFSGDDAFFGAMQQELIGHGTFRANLILEKTETMLHLTFRIRGSYTLVCDRSLDPFEEPFDTTQKLILKYGDQPQEVSDEIEIIRWDTPILNVARYLFEFIGLTVPMKKLHPRFRAEEEEAETAGKLVYSSKDEPDEEADEKPAADPRWEALNQLKNKGSRNGTTQ